ncbi:hypothetical protein L1987_65254 [Smallanthus sonchifolius]|uniref:Uncharacterized protein n=1 Tax=Smallanthus sonchifolius TaxID=185202 RepID=A0ACB9BTU2_9ASTR|nr:hypothetical protein L1987_65254 [Smallanthus sonchifolius]
MQFRSVSKTWKSLIESSGFIAEYSSQQQHLLVSSDYADDYGNEKYVSFVDDHTFPQHKLPLTLPLSLHDYDIIGCSHGLLCLYGYRYDGNDGLTTDMAVLWNMSIRKGVVVVVPNVGDEMCTTDLGFGVCRRTNDAKIVKIKYINKWSNVGNISCIPWQVEVFTLSTRAWRSPYTTNLPRKTIRFGWDRLGVDGFFYWLAIDRIAVDGGFRSCNLIISFDITSEEFRQINLPDSVAQHHLSMSKLRESLVVLERIGVPSNPAFVVWMMEDWAFTKLFTVNVNTPNASVKGFRKSGAPIVELLEPEYDHTLLIVYEPYLKCIDNLETDGIERSFSVYPYVETLFLLDQPDLTLQFKTTFESGEEDEPQISG